MKEYIASVRDKQTRELKIFRMEYETKKDFYTDLRNNGYSVRFITTEENFDRDCEKWHERNELNKRIAKRRRDSQKEFAKEIMIFDLKEAEKSSSK